MGRSDGADNYQWVGAVEQITISIGGADIYQLVGAVEQTTIR